VAGKHLSEEAACFEIPIEDAQLSPKLYQLWQSSWYSYSIQVRWPREKRPTVPKITETIHLQIDRILP
jgi:hypothetical protein